MITIILIKLKQIAFIPPAQFSYINFIYMAGLLNYDSQKLGRVSITKQPHGSGKGTSISYPCASVSSLVKWINSTLYIDG